MPRSNLPFPNLSIQGFRCFRNLAVSPLGRVTLITGKNDVGKSSVLEALRLFAQNAAADTLYDILTSRGEHAWSPGKESEFPGPEERLGFLPLFYGFPSVYDKPEAIVLKVDSPSQPIVLSLQIGWMVERKDGTIRTQEIVFEDVSRLKDVARDPVLVAATEDKTYTVPLAILQRRQGNLGRSPGRARMRCQFVDGCGESYALGRLWDQALQRREEDEAVKALQVIEPSITAVRMLGGDGSIPRSAFVQTRNFARLVPLRAFGDGLNRLFTLILTLLQAREGLLLIDKFESGLHHTVQLDTWRIVFQLARELDIQVFATTHSWDTVAAFQKAAAVSPEEGMLLRLVRREDCIVPTVFAEEELAVVTRRQIEVR